MARTGLPELFLRDDLPLALDDCMAAFRREVVGQDDACRAAANVVVTFKAGLNDPQRPLGVLLFCGPTGVGKTQMAKALSRYLFGHGNAKDRLVRLDMSEYAGYDAAERLIGRQDGRPSELIKKLRRQPFTVLLLDEIEKAAPEVFDVLLGVFDEGRLTDPYGRTTTFRSALIVMTSNLGATRQDPPGFDPAAGPNYEGVAQAFFRPEFFNRIDAVVDFEPLSRATICAITRKELAEITEREGLVKAELRLTWSDRLVERLAAVGFDPRYGARPLQRAIEARVVAPLARWLVENPGVERVELRLDFGSDGTLEVSPTATL